MQVCISEDLKQNFFEIKEKKIISIKELNKLQTKIFKERRWIIYGDYQMNFSLVTGLFLLISFLNVKFDFGYNIFIKMIVTEIIYQICKLVIRIYHLNSLHKILKLQGVGVAEVISIRQLINNQGFTAYNILNLTNFLFSPKHNKDVFQPIVADWQEEYLEALFKKETWKARCINVRYTYAFLAAMWQKSPIGDLIEFVIKIAKP